jgi:uridine kinase
VGRIAISVAGASCSGKTTLANALASELDAVVLRIDDYYRPLDHLTYEQRCLVNFDEPAAIDGELLTQHAGDLVRGRSIQAPRYDFTCHSRFPETTSVEPGPVLIVEGLFGLSFPGLSYLCDVRVFVDAPREVCLDRRIERDVAERGRTREEVVCRFDGDVWPMYLQHVLPCAEQATVRVSGCEHLGASLAQVLDRIVSPVQSQ